jgi:hypothetical protein
MDLDDQDLKTVATVTHEFQASAIVDALEEAGIKARAVGGVISDFREGFPAGVAVVVAESDLARAKQVVDELQQHRGEVDWSKVDVDNPDAGESP